MSPRRLGGLLDLTSCVGYWPLDSDPLDKSGAGNHGVEQNMARTNTCLYANDQSNATNWPRTSAGSAIKNAVGLNGAANTATTVTDSDAAGRTQWTQGAVVPVDTNTHTVSWWIKKDSDVSRFPLLFAQLTGGTSIARAICVNTMTGQFVTNNAIGTGTQRVVDGATIGYAAWWIFEITITNNGTASNTAFLWGFNVCYGNVINVLNNATTGSMVLGLVQVELNCLWFGWPPIFTTNAPVTISTATYLTGKIDAALRFDGLNDHLWVPGGVAALKWTGQDFSYGGWINVDPNETPDTGYIISKPWNGSGQYNYQVYVNIDRSIGVALVGVSTPFVLTTAAGVVTPGQWNHVFVTVEASTKFVKIYIDGRLAATGTHTIVSWVPSLTDTNERLALGTLYPYGPGWVGVTGQAFRGLLDDLRIYSRVLTADELSQFAALYISVKNDSVEFVHLLEFQFDSGTVRLATGAQDLSWNTFQWEAIGGLLDLGGIEETTDTRAQGVDVKLSGVDQTILAILLGSKYRGRVVKIWRAHLDRTTGRVIGTMMLFQGLQLSPYTVDEERDKGGGTVRISTRLSGYFGVERLRGIMSNLVSHQHYFNGDMFFANAASLANVKIYWGTPVPRTPGNNSGGGDGRGRTCFPAGTKVLLADGTEKSIEHVELGDLVAAFDPWDGSPQTGQVVGRMQHWANHLLEIEVGTRTLRVTPEHRIFIGADEFVPADELEVGSRVWCSVGGSFAPLEVARIEALPEAQVTVYNLDIGDYHTYVANGVAVHNVKVNEGL